MHFEGCASRIRRIYAYSNLVAQGTRTGRLPHASEVHESANRSGRRLARAGILRTYVYNSSAGQALGFTRVQRCWGLKPYNLCPLRYIQRWAPKLECTTTYSMLHDVHFAPPPRLMHVHTAQRGVRTHRTQDMLEPGMSQDTPPGHT